MRMLLIIAGIVFFVSCSYTQNSTEAINRCCISIDSVHLKNSQFIYSAHLIDYDGIPAVFYFYKADSSIHIYTPDGKKNSYPASNIAKRGVLNNFGSFYYHNPDTLFAISINPAMGYIFNLENEVVDSFPVKNKSNDPFIVFPNTGAPMRYNNGFLVAPVSSRPTFDSILQEYEQPIGVCVNLAYNENGVKVFGRRSKEELYSTVHYYNAYQYMTIADSKVVFSAQEDSLLYVFNPRNEQTEIYPCKSKYIDTIPRFPDSLKYNRAAKEKYNGISPRYESLIYSQYHNRFYRMVKHPSNELDQESSNSKRFTSKRSMIIMNDEFEVLDEIVISNPKYWGSDVPFPVSEGFYFVDRSTSFTKSGKICLDLLPIK